MNYNRIRPTIEQLYGKYKAFDKNEIRRMLYALQATRDAIQKHWDTKDNLRWRQENSEIYQELLKSYDALIDDASRTFKEFHEIKKVKPSKRIKSNQLEVNCSIDDCSCINCFNHNDSPEGYSEPVCNERGCSCINCRHYSPNNKIRRVIKISLDDTDLKKL
jgi:hypothetical protein